MQTLNDAYTMFNISSADDLEKNHICQLAITQAITNIYELRQRIKSDTIDKMPLFSRLKLGLKAARNIASHDYDSLDFKIVFKIINRLTSQQIINELEATLNGVKPSS
jgi:uncharacterized protein with HEPN domain